jgi:PAS domain S-box-containing protein
MRQGPAVLHDAPRSEPIHDFYFSAVENSAAGVLIVSQSGALLHVNPAVRTLLGDGFQSRTGEPLYSCFATDSTYDRIVDPVLRSLSTPDETQSENLRFWRDSTLLFLNLKISKFRRADGHLDGLVVVINDISHQQMRLAFGSIFASMSAVIFGYISLISFFHEMRAQSHSLTLISLMLVPFFGSVFILARSGLPIELLGVTWHRWRIHTGEAVMLSILGCAILTLAMVAGQFASPELGALPLFKFGGEVAALTPIVAAGALVYIALAPVQEFVARGTLQGPLEQVFGGKFASWKANITVNLMFSVFHQHIDMFFALMVLVPGIFWGWMYSRQRSLVGASISHAIIGIYALNVVNTHMFFEALLT